MLVRLYFVFLSVLVLTGCSSSNNAASKYLTKYDFTQLKSYQLISRDSKLAELQSMNDVLRNNIEYALEQHMDKLGFVFLANGESDILVSYFMLNNNVTLLKRYNKSVNYCSFCVGLYQSSDGKSHLKMKPGSLVIDVIDRKTKRSVWRAVSPLNIKTKDNSLEVNDKLHQAVSAMFTSFPVS